MTSRALIAFKLRAHPSMSFVRDETTQDSSANSSEPLGTLPVTEYGQLSFHL